ncbi:MAG TPA: alpha/beta fold hydrolase [Ktedonobacteraceae bacterium]|nr:alpha/beta fold hydrolase [Ktedonobacteraceae bacterium]
MAQPQLPTTPVDLINEMQKVEENMRTLTRVNSTRAAVGQTPRQQIWALNKTKLYRYVPVVPAEKRHRVPLLLVFALMNKPYILDLRPGNSFVEFMVNQGYDVYLLDWGAPGPEDKNMKLDDYVLDYLPRAIRKVKAVSGSEEFNMLGWCIGAILSTIYAALRPDSGLKSLVLLTAPLDFTDKKSGGFVRWVSDQGFDPEKLTDAFGNMPGEMIDYGAKALKPVENYIGSYLTLWDNLDNPRIVESWHAMNTWVTDIIPMAGASYRQLIKEMYQENRLMTGKLVIRGEHVDVSNIRANLLNVIALADHISPPCQSETIMEKVSSKDQLLLKINGGHIGMMAGSTAAKRTWPQINEWLSARSE